MRRFRPIFWCLMISLSAIMVVGQARARQSDELAIIERALAEAEAAPKLRFSYTMRFEWPGEEAVTTRFDAVERSWIVLSGDPSALPKAAQQKLKNIKKSESAPGGLLYADFRKHLRDIEFLNREGSDIIYQFTPPEADRDDVSATAEDAMLARLYVDAEAQILSRYEVRALEPFKPLPVVKLDEFVLALDFERLGETGPALMTRLYSRTKGKRLLNKVDTEFTATFSDFVRVD